MRRPLSQGFAALLFLAAAATPGFAQRDRAIRQAFTLAITPFVGATGFGERTTATLDGARYDYANGAAIGAQFDTPLTRRTGFLATVALTPITRVVGTLGPAVIDLDRALVAGVDLGFAGRLKPSAPLFVYLGGGATLATKRAAREPDGFGAEPRATAGFGIDLMRLERTGFRFLYMAHWVKPGTPDESRWVAKSTAFDQTFAIGGRLTLGGGRTTP